MKKMLLLLSTLIVAPAWAADAAPPPAATQAGVVIQLTGPAKGVSTLSADLEKDAVYKEASCSPAKKGGKIQCAKADGGLLTFLSRNAPAKVSWSISAAPRAMLRNTPAGMAAPAGSASGTCPPYACRMMNCPPPGGQVMNCCTANYQPC